MSIVALPPEHKFAGADKTGTVAFGIFTVEEAVALQFPDGLVAVTVYVPDVGAIIELVVAPFDHRKVVPFGNTGKVTNSAPVQSSKGK